MALKRLLKRAVTKAATKAAKNKAAKTAIQKAATAKKKQLLKKVAENNAKKSGLPKPSTRKPPTQSAAAKERQRVSAGQRKPTSKAKSSIKVAPTKRTSTVKSKVKLSETLRRRQARRSSSGKSPATGDKTKIAKIREAQKDNVGTSKRQAAIKANKSTSNKSYTPTTTKVSAKTKRADSRKTLKTTRTSSLPKSEKIKRAKSALRDRGAQHVVNNTPKSSTATAKAAGKPRQSQKNYSAGSRGPIYGPKTPAPKATNSSQVRSGTADLNARQDGRKALAKFNVEERLTKMKAATSNARMPNLTAAERQKLRRQKTKEINAKAQRVRELSERKSSRQQAARKNNVSPSAAKQNQVQLGNRDWRNRLSDSKAKGLSENATRNQTPGGTPKKAPYRRKDDPKPSSPRQSSTSVSRSGPGQKQATVVPKAKGGSTTTRITRDQNGQTTVSRPTAKQRRTGVEFTPQRSDVRGSNPKRGMQELPVGKKALPVNSRSVTTGPASTKQAPGLKKQAAKDTKSTEALKIRNQTKPKQTAAEKAHNAKRDKERPRLSARENSKRIRKSLQETRGMSHDSRTAAQRSHNQSVPREPVNRSKAQRESAQGLAPVTTQINQEQFGRFNGR